MSRVKSVRRRAARTTAVGALAVAACATLMTGSAGAIVNGTDSTERYPFMATIPESVPDPVVHDQPRAAGHGVLRRLRRPATPERHPRAVGTHRSYLRPWRPGARVLGRTGPLHQRARLHGLDPQDHQAQRLTPRPRCVVCEGDENPATPDPWAGNPGLVGRLTE